MTQTTSPRFVQAGQRAGQPAPVYALVALQFFAGIAQAGGLTPTTGSVTLDQAANGVPVVNIAKPNGAGISHNRYSQFNVGAQGLILNNSAQPVNTQLGGYITGNANLGAGSARLILNEVTAAAPSQLKGYMEVAGRRAGVVVANPYGITCDGCGFINTSKATLSTGTPLWRSDGTLEGFSVQQGLLRIEGAGLNADNTDGLALYARALELNAALYASALEVVTGASRIEVGPDSGIDAETGSVVAQAGVGVVPAYAIDSSVLGGMYAGTIRLVGTEAGVGMRLAGPVAALTGQLEILANGDVRLARASAQTSIAVDAAGSVQLGDLVTAGADVSLTTGGTLALTGAAQMTGTGMTLTAAALDMATDSTIAARGDLSVSAAQQRYDGTLGSAGALRLQGGRIDNTGQMAAGNSFTLSADDFFNTGRIDVQGGIASIDLMNVFSNASGILRHGGSALNVRALHVSNNGGELASSGLLDVVLAGAQALDNRAGRLQGNAGIAIESLGLDSSAGEIAGNGTITLTLGEGLLRNDGGLVETTGSIEITAGGLANTAGQLRAGENLTLWLPSFERAVSGGELIAQGQLALHTTGEIVLNGAELATPGSVWLDAGSAGVRIDSRLVSGSDTRITAAALTLSDDAVVAAQAALQVMADDVTNEGVLFGLTGITLQVADSLTNGNATSYRAAAILSEGDIDIGAADGGKIAVLDNFGGLIESQVGDIRVRATALNNINIGWEISDPYTLPSTFEYDPNKALFDSYYGCCSRWGEDLRATRIETNVRRREFTDRGNAGQILAGGNITLDLGTLLNDHSIISAAGVLDITATTITNRGTTLYDTITKTRLTRWHTCEYDSMGDLECWPVASGPVSSRSERYFDNLPAILEGRVQVKLQADVFNGEPKREGSTHVSDGAAFEGLALTPDDVPPPGNRQLGIADPTSFPGFNLPNNGLFRLNTDPHHPYLIETDPALNTYSGFLGSAYLLAHLEGWTPDITQRRLGDGYYELTLVREALLASLGSRFIDPAIADERAQFEYLMTNAIAASEALHLSPGIALSRAQIDALVADIVWMEERVIGGQEVLVPVVYLAQGSSRVLQDGSVIGGGAISISGETFSNAGLVRARQDVQVDTTGLLANLGGEIHAGGDLSLYSGGNLLNESGQLSGDNVRLGAVGDIVHRTVSTQEHAAAGGTTSTSTRVGETASVTARGDMLQVAGGTVQLTGAALSGNNITLAGEHIVLDTVKARQGYSFSTADWQEAEENVRHLQTEVEALQELRLMAEGDIIASAAWLRGGNVALEAGNNILLQAVTETDHAEVHSRHDGSRDDSSSDSVYDERRQVGTLIEATGVPAAGQGGNVILSARDGSILVDASAVAGAGDITVTAGSGINVFSGINTESYSLVTEHEGLTRFSNHQEGYISQTLAQAGFSAGGNLSLDSHGVINLAAAGLKAGALLQIGDATVRTDADGNALKDADGRLVIDRGTVSNINDVAVTLTNKSWSETQSGYTGPMEELVNVVSLLASNLNFFLTGGLLELPEIETGSRSSVQRETQTAATSTFVGRDILMSTTDRIRLQGTQLIATGLPDAEGNYTGGNVNILAGAIDFTTAESTSYEQRSSATQTSQALGMSTTNTEVQLAGLQITDHSKAVSTLSTAHQGVGINAANISLVADDAVGMVSAHLTADAEDGRLVIDAREISIGGIQDASTTTTEERVDTKTLTVGVRNAFVDATLAAKALADALEAIKEADDALDDAKARVAAGTLAPAALEDYRRNREAAVAQAAYLELAMGAAALTAAGTTATGGFYVSGSAQEESTRTTTTSTVGLWQGSNLSASQIRLTALESLSITGSSVTADSGVLDADTITVTAGSNTSSQSSYTTTTSQGITVSSSGTGSGALASAGTLGLSAGSSHAQSQAQSAQYVNSRLSFGTLASTSDALTLAGAVLEADTAVIKTGTLTITSLQDSSSSSNSSENHSAGISLSSGGLGGVNGAVGEGSGYSRSQMTGELSGIIVRNGAASSITAEDTILTGGLIANAVRDETGRLVDHGGLNFVTNTLVTHDLFDYSVSEQQGFNVGLGISLRPGETLKEGTTSPPQGASGARTASGSASSGNAGSIQPGTLTLGATHSGHRMEGITFATIGAGDVVVRSDALTGQDSLAGVNRDLDNTSIVTLDQDTRALDASASIDLRLLTAPGRKQIAKEQDQLGKNYQIIGDSIGEGVQTSIEVGVGLFVEGEAAKVLAAKIENQIGKLGIIPTGLNNGGLAFGQLPVFLAADDINQKRIVAAYQDSAYMKAHPELGWVSITETEGFYLLPADRRAELKNFMVSTVAVKVDPSLATYQNATTGMLNTEALALYNAYTQTGSNAHPENSVFTLNYNPTRDVIADGLESGIDKVATSDLFGILDTIRPFSFLSTTVADQTGDFMNSVMMAQGDKGANFACHSQGCLLTYSGLLSYGGMDDVDKFYEERARNFTFNMYGSPVNNVSFDKYLNSEYLLLASSTVNSGDYVGQSLGGNRGTYIFSTEVTPYSDIGATQFNPIRDLANKFNLWNAGLLFTSATPHATYRCTANCTNEKK